MTVIFNNIVNHIGAVQRERDHGSEKADTGTICYTFTSALHGVEPVAMNVTQLSSRSPRDLTITTTT